MKSYRGAEAHWPIRVGAWPLLDSMPMTTQRLQQIGVVIALLLLGVIVITTFQWLQQFLTFFTHDVSHLVGLVIVFAASILTVVLIAKPILTASRRYTGWVGTITGPNGRWLFLILIVLWGAAMALLALTGPAPLQGGALAFVGLLAGVFLFMGFIWSVIGE
jgi:hypothetical protein